MKTKTIFFQTPPRRRAFSSTLIAILAIAFISGAAAVLIASSAQQRALLSSFESRKTANHFANSVSFLNASFRDALLDSEFARASCGASSFPGFEHYVRAAATELNSSGAYTSYSEPRVETGYEPSPLTGFDYVVVANATFDLFASYGSAKKNESVFLEQRIDVNNTGTDVWIANASGLLITVYCPPSAPIP